MSYTTIRDINASVGQGIFTEADFFYKGKMPAPASHEINDAVIRGGEFIHNLSNARKPGVTFYWESTARFEGDSNYYVMKDGKSTNRLSRHSTLDAGDLNCNDRSFEKELVLVVAYDAYIGGPILEQLRARGINGLGAYYLTSKGHSTFLHLDGRSGGLSYFRKPSSTILEGKAERLYNEWMNDSNVLAFLGIAPLPLPTTPPVIVDNTPTPIETQPPVVEAPAPTPVVVETIEDFRESVINTVNSDDGGEDPVSEKFKRRSWAAFF